MLFKSYDGFDIVKPVPPNKAVCAEKCKKRERENPSINGMVWYKNTRICKCVIGMRGTVETEESDICYFGK